MQWQSNLPDEEVRCKTNLVYSKPFYLLFKPGDTEVENSEFFGCFAAKVIVQRDFLWSLFR